MTAVMKGLTDILGHPGITKTNIQGCGRESEVKILLNSVHHPSIQGQGTCVLTSGSIQGLGPWQAHFYT